MVFFGVMIAAGPPVMLPPRLALILNDPPGADCHFARIAPVAVRSKTDITPFGACTATGVPVRPPLKVSWTGGPNEPPGLAWAPVYRCAVVAGACSLAVPFWALIARVL